MIPLRVNDLKQYAYCPRIVFYQYVMPVDKAATYKMEQGKVAQEKIEELEKRRGLSKYGLETGTRRFHLWVQSEKLGMAGRIDMLIETAEALFPVDFKLTLGGVHKNHELQLCAYGMILEEIYGKPSPRGFVYLIPKKEALEVVFTEELRQQTAAAIESCRRMIETETLPPPTPVSARCQECEYRNYCNDIF